MYGRNPLHLSGSIGLLDTRFHPFPAGFSRKKPIVRAVCYRLSQMRRNYLPYDVHREYNSYLLLYLYLISASVPFVLFDRRRILFDADQDFFSERNAFLFKGSTLLNFSVPLILFIYSFAIAFIIYSELNFYNIHLAKKFAFKWLVYYCTYIFSLYHDIHRN